MVRCRPICLAAFGSKLDSTQFGRPRLGRLRLHVRRARLTLGGFGQVWCLFGRVSVSFDENWAWFKDILTRFDQLVARSRPACCWNLQNLDGSGRIWVGGRFGSAKADFGHRSAHRETRPMGGGARSSARARDGRRQDDRPEGIVEAPPAAGPLQPIDESAPAECAPLALRLAGSFSFFRSGEPTLRDLDITVREGELVAVIGGVASGKTALLQAFGPDRLCRTAISSLRSESQKSGIPAIPTLRLGGDARF